MVLTRLITCQDYERAEGNCALGIETIMDSIRQCLLSVMDDEENSAKELRYKCRRHNADYYTDSAIPDNSSLQILVDFP
jgi:hypothetical protein